MKHNKPNAFTLLELLVVITIIGILASLSIPLFNAAIGKQKVHSREEYTAPKGQTWQQPQSTGCNCPCNK